MQGEFQSSTHQSLHHYKEGLGQFTQKVPHIAQAFNAFTEACFQRRCLITA